MRRRIANSRASISTGCRWSFQKKAEWERVRRPMERFIKSARLCCAEVCSRGPGRLVTPWELVRRCTWSSSMSTWRRRSRRRKSCPGLRPTSTSRTEIRGGSPAASEPWITSFCRVIWKSQGLKRKWAISTRPPVRFSRLAMTWRSNTCWNHALLMTIRAASASTSRFSTR